MLIRSSHEGKATYSTSNCMMSLLCQCVSTPLQYAANLTALNDSFLVILCQFSDEKL